MELYILAVVVFILIGICVYRVIKYFKTETRNSTIFFLLIWLFTLITVVFGLAGKNTSLYSLQAEILLRAGDSFTIGIMLSMTFFANSILYGGIFKRNKALLISIYVIIEAAIILTFYWVLPGSFLIGANYNELTYDLNEIITVAYVPLILPILYVFINMGKVDQPNKKKYSLYLIGFLCAIVELAFDMPGTLPELLFIWRLFALASMILVIIALLLPKAS